MSTEISGHTRAVARSPLLRALRRASAPTWLVAAPRLTNGVRAVLVQESTSSASPGRRLYA
jgi:hypothetical protein